MEWGNGRGYGYGLGTPNPKPGTVMPKALEDQGEQVL